MFDFRLSRTVEGRFGGRKIGVSQPDNQDWKTFLRSHAAGLASLDRFVVRTNSFKLLYSLVILAHARTKLVTISVTANPPVQWTAGQVTDAFPRDEAQSHLIRDRAFGLFYTRRIRARGVRDHPTARRSLWQNGYVEHLIDSIRRESLNHMFVFDETQFRRVLKNYASCYNQVRTPF